MKIDDVYAKRYQRLLKKKEKSYDLNLPDEQKTFGSCEHSRETSVALVESKDDDLPKKIVEDPYQRPMHQCVFCKHNIPMDYKNVQLLSQFVSSQTGIIYSQQVTGLCIYKYGELERTIQKSRRLGLMPFFYKDTVFMRDPTLFNPAENTLKEIPNNYDKRKLNSD